MSSSFRKDPTIREQLKVYLKIVGMGSFFTILLIFSVFSIFWGALYKIPARPLAGWVIVCFIFIHWCTAADAFVGLWWRCRWPNRDPSLEQLFNEDQLDSSFLKSILGRAKSCKRGLRWKGLGCRNQYVICLPIADFSKLTVEVNPEATTKLQASLVSSNASYDGSEAISVFSVEARNENAL